MVMSNSGRICAAILVLFAAACGQSENGRVDENTPNGAVNQSGEDAEASLAGIIAGEHRSDEERARDEFRHPAETLAFFGLEPDMTVVEIWPGGGWYTQIIAPYLAAGEGRYYAAGNPREGASERTIAALDRFQSTYVDNPEVYGEIIMSAIGEGSQIAPDESADLVLTFRNVHNWLGRDRGPAFFDAFFKALKPGGVLGVVEHRADGTSLPDDGSSGYVFTQDVIDLATAAGFEFEASSEINANAADTKDHPFGVWTLPPVRRSSEIRGMEDPEFDRAKFDAIGESDRMTLRFRKPVVVDDALLE